MSCWDCCHVGLVNIARNGDVSGSSSNSSFVTYVTEGLRNEWVIYEPIGIEDLEGHSLADYLRGIFRQSEDILVLNIKGRTIDGNCIEVANSLAVKIFIAPA